MTRHPGKCMAVTNDKQLIQISTCSVCPEHKIKPEFGSQPESTLDTDICQTLCCSDRNRASSTADTAGEWRSSFLFYFFSPFLTYTTSFTSLPFFPFRLSDWLLFSPFVSLIEWLSWPVTWLFKVFTPPHAVFFLSFVWGGSATSTSHVYFFLCLVLTF